MNTLLRPTVLALALLAAFPASAQNMDAVMREIQALRNRVAELEKQVKDAQAAKPAGAAAAGAAAAPGQWGMTPEQVRELNRITVKAEATEDNLEAQGFKGLTISGYMEPTYIYNRAQKRSGFQFLNSQADGYFYDTSYIGSAVIDFVKETDSGSRFKLTLGPNRGAGAATSGGMSIVQEASVSIPLTDLQTRFIAGQVADWSGYEYQQPTLNPFITHNLLFDLTLPLTYVGAGIDYTQGKWWLRGMIANVNENIRAQGERSPAAVWRIDYSRGEFEGWGTAGLFGKTTNFNLCRDTDCTQFKKTDTLLLEVDGYFIRGDWTVQGQIAYGKQKQAAIIPDAAGNFRDAEWTGLSALAG